MGPIDSSPPRRKGPGRVGLLAELQHGHFTRLQLLSLGMSEGMIDHWVRTRRLIVIHPGVYALGHRPLTREGRWMAAVLFAGPGAALSHLSAAAHLELVERDPVEVHVTGTRGRKGTAGVVVHRPRRPPEVVTHRGIVVTTVARTLLDAAPLLSDVELERALGEAELRGRLEEGALLEVLATHPRRSGVRRLRRVLASHEAGCGIPRNEMELRFRAICRGIGLPEPESNVALLGWEVDFLWRDLGIAVETDGRSVHARRAAFARDRRKDRDLQLGGFLALRFTHGEIVRTPQVVRAALAAAAAGRAAA